MNILPKAIDERFLEHRRRSLSAAGMCGGIVAGGLFLYHLYADHRFDRDLFAVLVTFAVVKVSLMAWYTLRD